MHHIADLSHLRKQASIHPILKFVKLLRVQKYIHVKILAKDRINTNHRKLTDTAGIGFSSALL
jgi:hypothetical protein